MVDQVKIVLTTEDSTQPGFDAVQRNSEKTRKALDDLYASAERIGRSGGSFDAQVASAKAYYETIDRINRQLAAQRPDGIGSAIDQAQASAQKLGAASEGVDRLTVTLDKARQQAEETAKAFSKITIGPAQIEMSDGAIKGLTNRLEKIDLSGWQAKMAYGMAAGVGAGVETTRTMLDKMEEWAKAKAVVVGVSIAAIMVGGVVGAVYTAYRAAEVAYKAIKGTVGFTYGLFTGDSYKSENIDALIALNAEVLKLQNGLKVSAVDASALNEALKIKGVDQSAYIATFDKATSAIHTNGEELSRLGIKYKDARGNLLPLNDTMASAAMVLATYTDGWDRHQAAVAIGMGSEKDIQQYLSVTRESVEQSRQRLVDYGLVIGAGTQAAVERYKTAMREFDNEAELTSLGLKKAIADQIMPALTDLAQFFKDGWPLVIMPFRYTMATLVTGLYGLWEVATLVFNTLVFGWKSAGDTAISVTSAIFKAAKGDFAGSAAAMSDLSNKLLQNWADYEKKIVDQSKHNVEAIKLAWGFDNFDPASKVNQGKGKPWDDGKAAKAAREATAEWKRLYATQAEQKKAAFKELDDAYSKETVTVGNNLQKQLDLAKEYQTKRAEIDKKFEPKKEADPYGDLIKSINLKLSIQQQEIDGTAKLTESEKVRAKAQQDIIDGTLKLTAAQKEYLYGKLDLLVANEKSIVQEAAIQKGIAERYQAGEKELEQIQQQIDAQIEHNAVIGLTPAQIEAVKAARLDEDIVAKQTLLRIFDENGVRGAQIELIREQVIALGKLRQAHIDGGIKQAEADAAKASAEAWQAGWHETDKIARKVFDEWGVNGSNAAQQIGKTLKTALMSAIYDATLRPVVFQMYGMVTNALGMQTPAGANLGGAGSLLSGANNAYSLYSGNGLSASGMYGSFAASSFGQSIGLSSTANFVGPSSALAMDGAATTAAVGSEVGLTSLGSTLSAAVPYVAAAMALYSMFAGQGGGPKVAGDWHIGTTATGYNSLGDWRPDTDQSGNANFSTALGALSGDYHKYAAALGGKASALQIGLGNETDPQGTATSSIYSQITDASGKTIYSNIGQDVGRDSATMAAALQTEAKRLLLASLQASDLPKAVAAVLSTVDAAGATSESIDKVLTLADTFKTLGQILPQIDALTSDQIKSLAGSVGDQFTTQVSAYYQTFFSQTERDLAGLSTAQAQVSDTFATLHMAVPKSDDEFKKLVSSLDLTTDSGKSALNALMQIAPTFDAIQKATTNLFNNAVSAYIAYQSAAGNTSAAMAGSSAMAAMNSGTAQDKLAASFGIDRGTLDKAITQAGGNLADIAMKYWGVMSDAQRAAITEAMNAKTAYIGAVKAQFDEQLKVVQSYYANVKKLADFSAGIDANIANVQIAAGLLTQADYNAQQTAKVNAALAALGPDASVDDKLGLATQLRDLTMERWQIEMDSLTKAKEFAGSVRDYLNNLKVSDNSPLDLQTKLAEAAKQYADTLTAAKGGDATAESALTGKSDAWLTLAKQYGMGEWANVYQQVQDGLGPLADTLSIDQQALATQKTTAQRAADTVTQLQAIKGQAATWQTTEQGLLDSAVAALQPLSGILDSLGAGGAIASAIHDLPSALAALIGGKTLPTVITSPGGATSSLNSSGNGQVALGGSWSGTVVSADQIRTGVMAQMNSGVSGVDIYNQVKDSGMSLAQFDAVMGTGAGSAEAWAKANGLPSFDVGINNIPHDMLALVHQDERILPAADNRELFDLIRNPPSSDNGAVVAELRAVRAEIAELRREQAAGKQAELQQRGAVGVEQIARLDRVARASEAKVRSNQLAEALS